MNTRRGGRPFVVHRLDKDTSGLMIFARSPEIRDLLQDAWPTVKTYIAVVEGRPKEDTAIVESYLAEGRDMLMSEADPKLGGKLARTEYTVLASHDGNSLIEVILHTGKKHQIRVHMKDMNCPVWGILSMAGANPQADGWASMLGSSPFPTRFMVGVWTSNPPYPWSFSSYFPISRRFPK